MANNILARRAPDVSFIHDFPGWVKTSFGKDARGFLAVATVVSGWITTIIPRPWVPPQECGARHLFLATSARYPPATGDALGVPFRGEVAKGTDGKPGTGSYSLGVDCESSSQEVCNHLLEAKASGAEDRMWSHILAEIKGVTGKSYGGT